MHLLHDFYIKATIHRFSIINASTQGDFIDTATPSSNLILFDKKYTQCMYCDQYFLVTNACLVLMYM